MTQYIQQRFRPVPMSAGQSLKGTWDMIGGFLPKTTGTLTITDANGTVVLDAFPVNAGIPAMLYMQLGPANVGGAAPTGDKKVVVALTTTEGTLLVG